MLKNVSDNIINLLKYFTYTSINKETYYEFFEDKLEPTMCDLAEKIETNPNENDKKLLSDIEAAIDELYDDIAEDIDLDDINERLKNKYKY